MNKKQVRDIFRNEVLERDNHQCRHCSSKNGLAVHHITDRKEMPNGGYVKENGITLCERGHKEAEEWHKSNKQTWEPGLHPSDLYKLINSSYELAYQKSLLLEE